MAKILSFYNLCPLNSITELIGLSQDAEPGSIINTLGKNIVMTMKVL